MKTYHLFGYSVVVLALLALSFACSPRNCPVVITVLTLTPTSTATATGTLTSTNTSTDTFTATNTLTFTNTNTPTASFTSTATNTSTPSPTETPTCMVLYADNFSTNTFSNYEMTQRQSPNIAPVTITGGEMVVSAPGSGYGGVEILITNASLSHSLANYMLDFDAKMDISNTYGDFGAAFRGTVGSPNSTYYSFLWNRNPEHIVPHWQEVDFHGVNAVNYAYLGGSGYGAGQASPAYTIGNWVHVKVVCIGNNFRAYVDTGSGLTLVDSWSDSTYSAGGVGFQADFLQNSNAVHFKNLVVSNACY